MRIVQKYGGTSLETPECFRTAARRLTALHRQGVQVVAVVSARGDTTDVLLRQAAELNARGNLRERDALMATGEQLSAALMALTIEDMGSTAVSLTGLQAGIHTDSVYGKARILNVNPERIRQELALGKIVVVAGFQGADSFGNITTLGRGGSDTTAVALAAALHADKCQIFTDVDGIYDRDPRQYADAVRYDRIGYDRMLRMAREGAQVLHDRCVELAKEQRVKLEVLSSFADVPGTIVSD